MIDRVFAVFVRVRASLPLSVVMLAAPVLLNHFWDVFRVCYAGYPIYAGSAFDSVLHDAESVWSGSYNLIWSPPTREEC